MVVEKGISDEGKGERSCIVVGVQIDGDGRELLRWVITNLAEESQRVVAINVSRTQDLSRNPASSLINVLDECLADHHDLCTVKKIVLVGRITKGNSIKKVLVKEAETYEAKTLVVGANKNYSFGQKSTSLAKYCDKKLPSGIDLIAVHKGEIIFKRAKAKPLPVQQNKRNLQNYLPTSVDMYTKFISLSSNSKKPESKDYCLLDYDMMRKTNRNSISVLVKKLPEPKPGWPLLRIAETASIEASKESEERKMSVIHWVMKLPDRSLAAASTHVEELVNKLEIVLEINSSSCKFFRYEELQNSTNYFSPGNLIGRGGNSQVYKGSLPDGQKVAIKVSKLSEESSRDFILEVEIITRVQHVGVVPLIGICVEDRHFYSVYSFFSRGSLEDNLHGKILKAPVNWDIRFKVAVGVAEALSYLHENCSRTVIHRDIKSSNILLSDEFKPLLSDFGLAIWDSTTAPCLTHSDVVGTFGYLAPEYFMYGKVSNKVDVYAFGVVLLELLSGRKPINDKNPKGQESLVMWAEPMLERGDIMEILDPNLNGKYEEEEMQRMVMAASLCIRREARHRPPIRQVLDLLQGKEETKIWKKNKIEAGNNVTEQDWQDDEVCRGLSIGSHLGLALLDVEDDDASIISFEQNNLNSLDEYILDRWSRSSSFN